MAVLLGIDNLPSSLNENDLARLCERFGTVLSASVLIETQTNCSLGIGLVRVPTAEDAEWVRVALHGKRLGDEVLTVTIMPPLKDAALGENPSIIV
jgi:RNA recognition motif-containing protein